jgi:hypothetical protein
MTTASYPDRRSCVSSVYAPRGARRRALVHLDSEKELETMIQLLYSDPEKEEPHHHPESLAGEDPIPAPTAFLLGGRRPIERPRARPPPPPR